MSKSYLQESDFSQGKKSLAPLTLANSVINNSRSHPKWSGTSASTPARDPSSVRIARKPSTKREPCYFINRLVQFRGTGFLLHSVWTDEVFDRKKKSFLHSQAKHSMLKPHVCELCSRSFSQKGNLRSHVLRVHTIGDANQRYKCDTCSCTFRKLGSLNAHMSKVHAEDAPETEPDAVQENVAEHPGPPRESNIGEKQLYNAFTNPHAPTLFPAGKV